MRKIVSVFLFAFCLCLSLVACEKNENPPEEQPDPSRNSFVATMDLTEERGEKVSFTSSGTKAEAGWSAEQGGILVFECGDDNSPQKITFSFSGIKDKGKYTQDSEGVEVFGLYYQDSTKNNLFAGDAYVNNSSTEDGIVLPFELNITSFSATQIKGTLKCGMIRAISGTDNDFSYEMQLENGKFEIQLAKL